MTRTILAALVASAALAAPASANDMLARSLGVAPGAYSLSELVALKSAIDNNDRQAERALRRVMAPQGDGPLYVIGVSDKSANAETGAYRADRG